jgi:DNA-binding CsgD family transcriptional regulator
MNPPLDSNPKILVADLRTDMAIPTPVIDHGAWEVQSTDSLAAVLDVLTTQPPACIVLIHDVGDRLTQRVLTEAARAREVPLINLDIPVRMPDGSCEISPTAHACMHDLPALETLIGDALTQGRGDQGPASTRHSLAALRDVLDEASARISQLEQSVGTQPAAGHDLPLETLSHRERDVLDVLRTGTTNKEIAIQLQVSPHTVGNHLRSVYRKLGVGSRAELLARFAAG